MTTAIHERGAAFDQASIDEVRSLVWSHQERRALARLREHRPADRAQAVQFHGLSASAHYHLGEFAEATAHWIRALRHSERDSRWRTRIRAGLGETLLRAGRHSRAEQVLLRALAEIRTTPGYTTPTMEECLILSRLGRLHEQRGTLHVAVRFYENAIDAMGDGSVDRAGWQAARSDFVETLSRLGEFERASRLLAEVDAPGLDIDPLHVAPVRLTRAELELERGDLDACARAVAAVPAEAIGDEILFELERDQVAGALCVARGEPAAALAVLEPALEKARTAMPTGELLTELARVHATALLALGRPAEALVAAREAVAACRGDDMIDLPASLRIAARCLAALGRRAEARTELATALSLLESTEFVVERRKLYAEMAAQDMALPSWLSEVPLARAGAPEPDAAPRHVLRDGRTFVTTDRDLLERVRRAAESRLPILLEGETGTGKELIARLVHELGPDRDGPFVVVDCTTLSEGLAEAELFGVVRGAYTGAAADRVGLVGAADGGTLLFDELPELSLAAQSKLLRLLQEGTYRRLGEAKSRRVTIRVIATANQDTEQLLASGKLKPDLFFRLHGYRIRLRPLRERPQEIALLAAEFARAAGLAGVAPDAVAALRAGAWPGNARQLEMLVRAAAAGARPGGRLEAAALAPLLADAPRVGARTPEAQRLQAALDAHGGNVAATARSLGMSRQGLYKALHRHGLI